PTDQHLIFAAIRFEPGGVVLANDTAERLEPLDQLAIQPLIEAALVKPVVMTNPQTAEVLLDVAPNPAHPERRQRHRIFRNLLPAGDRKSTRLNSSHSQISYAVFCLKKKKIKTIYIILTNNQNYYIICYSTSMSIA